ncbi:MAG: hypothetical protein IPO24_18865 [Bacteroidetes bacterium]|nr:hypothetical protein [Bacteroidota bacterium]
MEYTTIVLGGITISEPITSLTDLITGAVCLYCFLKLRAVAGQKPGNLFFAYYFLFIGIAVTYSAIIGHAFFHLFNDYWKIPGWVTGACAIFLFESAAIFRLRATFPKSKGIRIASALPLLQLLVFLGFMISPSRSFSDVRMNSAIGMIGFVLPIMVYLFYFLKHSGYKRIIFGILLSLAPAMVYYYEITVNKWFNFHDISHVLMAICMFIMYTGVYKLFTLNNTIELG